MALTLAWLRQWHKANRRKRATANRGRMTVFKCDDCGHFISYADLDSRRARRKLIYPDSAFTVETWETVCARCVQKEAEPTTHMRGSANVGFCSP
jgi:hypothetical protein